MAINKYRDMETAGLEGRVDSLGTAGLSNQQKSQMRGQATQAAAQQAQVQQTGLNRAMQAQGGQMQGAYAQQAQQLASGSAQAGAQAGMQAEQMSQQVAAARDTQIRADLARQSDKTTANWNKAVDTYIDYRGQNKQVEAAAVKAGTLASDRRLKQNIESAGVDSATGLNLYDFEYKSDPSRRFRGVMADEVEVNYPDAVVYGDDGYAKVYYGLLGLEMTEI